ncbi:uncharacterized protein PHALS_03898 [Plasmopara halstedii]|uniref:Uncharacterized protein n=1 Tax=Plasmopara halstedii TaxID=4781 RepID=A0A0N7L7J5_PLAHL|nr:uncharacterized protein PHALS_03898 [Plasmopara halstedii]CEG47251.1 hypothetical protein PHALS_03898 [Plasmopara halstedii]|eukprot:XP_024583620.1 hypothetical protein PHALS_03898 [Plasmopara halstedii]
MVQPIRIGESRSITNTEKLGFISIVSDSSYSPPSNTFGHVETEEQQRDH